MIWMDFWSRNALALFRFMTHGGRVRTLACEWRRRVSESGEREWVGVARASGIRLREEKCIVCVSGA